MRAAAGTRTNVERAAAAIVRAAKKNKHLTVVALQRELEDGYIVAWEGLCARHRLNFAEWSSAMSKAILTLRGFLRGAK
jgi:phenylpyruvate tautomerase PptA (4-oxalocrotonate tautomerase family)